MKYEQHTSVRTATKICVHSCGPHMMGSRKEPGTVIWVMIIRSGGKSCWFSIRQSQEFGVFIFAALILFCLFSALVLKRLE